MSLRQKILIFILSIVMLYAGYFWGVPAIVNVPKNIDKYENIIFNQTGCKFDIKNPHLKMGFTPSVWFWADEFILLNKNNSTALKIDNPKIEISLIKLLLLKLNITYFSADEVDADIIYSKDEKLYIGDYLIPKDSKSKIAMDINKIKLNIQEYKIDIHDYLINQHNNINGDFIVVDKYIKNKKIKASASAELVVNSNTSVVNFDIDLKLPLLKKLSKRDSYLSATITNFDLSCLSKYISYLSNKEYYDLKGKLNFESHSKKIKSNNIEYETNFTLENFGINGKDFAIPYYYNDRIDFSSVYTTSGKDLDVKNLLFKSKSLNVNLYGKIKKITTNNPILDLYLNSKNARAEDLVALLPANNKFYEELEFDIETLVKEKFFADVNLDIHILGNTKTPDIAGDLYITNAYVTNKPISNGADKATINLKFDKDKILLDVFVPASVKEYVTVEGFVELYGKKNVDLLIKSTQNVDLGIAQYVLMPVHKVLNFDLGPVPIMDIDGIGNIDLAVTGNKFDPHALGRFNFRDGIVSFNDVHNMVIKEASGYLTFEDQNAIFRTKSAKLNNQSIKVTGNCTLFGVLNFDVFTQSQPVAEVIKILKTSPMLSDIAKFVKPITAESGLIDLSFKLKGEVKNTYDIIFGKNIFASGSINLKQVSATLNDIILPVTNINGLIVFDNLNIKLNLESLINKSKLKINGNIIDNLANINIISENMSLDDIIEFVSNHKFIPLYRKIKDRQGLLVFSANYNGAVDKLDLSKLKCEGIANFKNYYIKYMPLNLIIEIPNGNISIKNDSLLINNTNLKLADMPVFVSGKVNNIYKNPEIDFDINSRPTQNFIDALFNRKSVYPIKLKGDFSNSLNVKGYLNNFDIKSTFKIAENSKLYYMGAILGNEINPIVINLDANIKNNKDILIHNFTLDKILKTNNNKTRLSREISISGGIAYSDKNIHFNNFKIKTLTPTDSRLFNIIFKKPYIKQGNFNSDLKINGYLNNPKIQGKLDIHDISIPDYHTKINSVNLNFLNKYIDTYASGSFMGNKLYVKVQLLNNFELPYLVNYMHVYLSTVNIGKVVDLIRSIEMDSDKKLTANHTVLPIKNNIFVINDAKFNFDNILLDNILLTDFSAKGSYNKDLNVSDFKFKTSDGIIKGKYYLNTKYKKHSSKVVLEDIDAKLFTETLFNLKNQISGNLNGQLNMTCSGYSQDDCLKTLNGSAGFKIVNGKMPKLGSMEYLLNAANLIKGGITGLSLNGLIDLISPLKTGEFDSITGSVSVSNGDCQDIQVFSQGKNLNLFMVGSYNLTTSIAKMQIFGRLLKNTSSILGPIGNASLNALFNTIPGLKLSKISDNTLIEYINKIPGIDLDNNKYRIFTVDINGDINGNDYVRSFQWVE